MLAAIQSGALTQDQVDELLAGKESVLDKQENSDAIDQLAEATQQLQ